MKKVLMLLTIFGYWLPAKTQTDDFMGYPVYTGNDLGLKYTPAESSFRIWAPSAQKAELIIYNNRHDTVPILRMSMRKSIAGTWTARLMGNQEFKLYAFRVMINGKWRMEVPDPYAKATSVNGKKAMIINLKKTNPPGWEKDKSPVLKNKTDAIIYELHIRDASIANNSGIKNKGKYLGLTETATKNEEGHSTGLDHLKELGITHVHLLPFYDINSVDESQPEIAQYNWGYDPLNYNVPEGSYSTNALDGATRIRELKQMIKTFHENGLRVVMDVVYNHTALTETSNFNQLVPGYFYRQAANGNFSNATACGNETASERPMVRKFILESMKYWAQEYHIDGFRIDLMGVHDIETMNLISRELHKFNPGILLYGEGWTAGSSPLPDSLRALKKYAHKLDRIAVFSDDIRDGIKGHVFKLEEKGFVSGNHSQAESVKFGIVASVSHPQIEYQLVNYSPAPYASQPWQTITYAECHDNHTLWDRLLISAPSLDEKIRTDMHKLALSIVLTSQGISFLHAGTEFLRSKHGIENSFESPDSINWIDWSLKSRNLGVFNYVKGLIKMRLEHPAFRMITSKQIRDNIHFKESSKTGMIVYTINGTAVGDSWKKIIVLLNGNALSSTIELPTGSWKTAIRNNEFVTSSPQQGNVKLNPFSCTLLYQ